MDRVSDSDSGDRRFESCQAHQNECSHGIEMSVEHSFFVSSAKRGNAKVNRVKAEGMLMNESYLAVAFRKTIEQRIAAQTDALKAAYEKRL